MTNDTTNNYIELANAIIKQASDDYLELKKMELKYGVLYEEDAKRMKDLKEFFTGKWYSRLTTLDGEYLMKLLDKKAKEETKT